MTLSDFNAFCASLPAATYVIQWRGAYVWKVGAKVFAIGRDAEDTNDLASVTFKAGDLSYELLKDQPGLRPAPYLASRGMKWIQHYAAPGLGDEDLRAYLRQSHALVVQGLSKKARAALGLNWT